MSNTKHLNSHSSDFCIVGAGIMGLLLARSLAAKGYSVTLIEKSTMGQEASWAGGGILSPLHPWKYPPAINELAFRSQSLYPILTKELYDSTQINIECLTSGALMIDVADKAEAIAWAKQHQKEYFELTASQLHEVAPNMISPQHSALWLPHIGQVRNPRLLQALITDVKNSNIHILEQCEVKKLLVQKRICYGVMTDSQQITAAKVVLTAGAWSSGLLNPYTPSVDIKPIKGQMLCIKAPKPIFSSIILTDSVYLIPRADGHILVGSTIEDVGYDKTITKSARVTLLDAAYQLCPDLKHYPIVKQWAGLRPYSASEIPVTGPVGDVENLFINAGHYRNGLILAPAATEKLEAELLC